MAAAATTPAKAAAATMATSECRWSEGEINDGYGNCAGKGDWGGNVSYCRNGNCRVPLLQGRGKRWMQQLTAECRYGGYGGNHNCKALLLRGRRWERWHCCEGELGWHQKLMATMAIVEVPLLWGCRRWEGQVELESANWDSAIRI